MAKMSAAKFQSLINVSATPARLPTWFVPYTYWRMLRARGISVPPGKFLRPKFPKNITVKEYGWVLDEWDRYLMWERWISSGRKGPRPAGLWVNKLGKPISPAWAGATLKLVLQYTKVPPIPPPVPPAPHDYDVSLGFSWICMAQNPEKALMYPAYFGIMFTADQAYAKPTHEQISMHRERGQRVRSWCDCHTTFPDTAKKMAADFNLDGWVGEGESSGAFQTAMDAGCELIIINLSAITPDQKAKYIATRKTVAINELYLNQDSSRAARENWDNLPIAGRMTACYDAKSEADTGRYFSMQEYISIGRWTSRHDSFYDPGAQDTDRKLVT